MTKANSWAKICEVFHKFSKIRWDLVKLEHSPSEQKWLSLTEASEWLGVHPATLRRWSDAGKVPCFRTPGGHRRFRVAELSAWVRQKRMDSSIVLAPRQEILLRHMISLTRQEMATQQVSGESWYLAFEQEPERQQMRDCGRRLFELTRQYLAHTGNRDAILGEARHIGAFIGERCGWLGISLADTLRAFLFFRESLLRNTGPGQIRTARQAEREVGMRRELNQFLDEVMYACLARYDRIRYDISPSVSET